MGVVRAQIQTVEEIYRLVWTAVANRQPIEANYQGRYRLFCPHRLGRNREGQLRVLCYQYGGESPEWTRPIGFACELALCCAGETQQGEVSGRRLAHSAESFPAGFLRGRSRYRRGGSARARSTKGTLRKLSEQLPGKDHSQCGNRIWIMPFWANAVIPAGGSPAPARA